MWRSIVDKLMSRVFLWPRRPDWSPPAEAEKTTAFCGRNRRALVMLLCFTMVALPASVFARLPRLIPAQAQAEPSQTRRAAFPGPTEGTADDESIETNTRGETSKKGSALAQEVQSLSDWSSQRESLRHALIRLPIAALFSAVLAFRPRRRGTPTRQMAVIQTQIILAIVGAVVMLVVGVSLARAFGIVGAAGLIRYRAKVADPKDAGVMLSTLSLGLAAGVGLYLLATFATFFILGVLWLIESIESEPYAMFLLTIGGTESAVHKADIERTLRRHQVSFDLRGTSAEGLSYEVKVPLNQDTEGVSAAIAAIDRSQPIEVAWKKEKDG